MNLLEAIIAGKLGGGPVTPAAVVTATGAMTSEQQAQTRENIGAGEPLTPEQIADGAGAWLEDNLATPSTPPIDSTLSVANAAADAKAVGELKSTIELGYQKPASGNFTQGTWSGGAISTAGNRICAKTLYPVKKNDRVYIKTNTLEIAHGIYESGKTASTDYQTWHSVPGGAIYYVPVDGNMFFQCRKAGDANVTPSEFDATIQIYNNEPARNTNKIDGLNAVVLDALGELVDYGFDPDGINYKIGNIDLAISKTGSHISVNGSNTSSYGVRVRVNNLMATYDSSVVAGWNNGLSLRPGHTYVIENKLISGSISGNTNAPTISVYPTGTSASAGDIFRTYKGSKRFFTAQYGKEYNIALYINAGTTLTNAVYEIVMRDITETLANATKSIRAYTRSTYAIGQSCVLVNGNLYVYHSDAPTGITKIEIKTGTETEYAFDFDHGNDMTVYDGKLYICSMNDNGTIHIVSLETMEEISSVDFTVSGVKTANSAIAYDAVNDQFIIKSDSKFYFADTSLTYKSSVDIGYLSPATSQGIETDGYYIYWVKSSPNTIEVFDFSGACVDIVKIATGDEPESLYLDNFGGWWLLTNVVSGGWYFDAVQITDKLTIGGVASLIQALPASD